MYFFLVSDKKQADFIIDWFDAYPDYFEYDELNGRVAFYGNTEHLSFMVDNNFEDAYFDTFGEYACLCRQNGRPAARKVPPCEDEREGCR